MFIKYPFAAQEVTALKNYFLIATQQNTRIIPKRNQNLTKCGSYIWHVLKPFRKANK